MLSTFYLFSQPPVASALPRVMARHTTWVLGCSNTRWLERTRNHSTLCSYAANLSAEKGWQPRATVCGRRHRLCHCRLTTDQRVQHRIKESNIGSKSPTSVSEMFWKNVCLSFVTASHGHTDTTPFFFFCSRALSCVWRERCKCCDANGVSVAIGVQLSDLSQWKQDTRPSLVVWWGSTPCRWPSCQVELIGSSVSWQRASGGPGVRPHSRDEKTPSCCMPGS